MNVNMIEGSAAKGLIFFSLPMIAGNLLQQFYNIADTLIVGRFLGPTALGAVGTSYALMVLLTSIILGLCMGSGVVFSCLYGQRDFHTLRCAVFNAFIVILALTLILNLLAFLFLTPILALLHIPAAAFTETRLYLKIIFTGILFTFIYNFLSSLLRSLGNSVTPLIFLFFSAVSNIFLDLLFIVRFHMGVEGAAAATIIAQGLSAVAMLFYTFLRAGKFLPKREHCRVDFPLMKRILDNSVLTSLQQSIMNLGILMVQGLVNSFGLHAMAAFAAAVKIDAFAYMPAQDFGNAFATFTAQNFGAGKPERIRAGFYSAMKLSISFCLAVSAILFFTAPLLMRIFVCSDETEIIAIGTHYLRIEGSFYLGIGVLFLLYGLYRGLEKAKLSIVLTIISLGTRVALAYLAAPGVLGLTGIWIAIPVGWFLADVAGLLYWRKMQRRNRGNRAKSNDSV